MFVSAGRRLRNHWLSHGLDCNPGASEISLAAFKNRLGLALSPVMRDYLNVNGMPENVTEGEMIRFWTLGEIKNLATGTPYCASEEYVGDPESLFLFADYSIWAHAYAVRLTRTHFKANEVVIIWGNRPMSLNNSFSEFVEVYLGDKDLVFPRRPSR